MRRRAGLRSLVVVIGLMTSIWLATMPAFASAAACGNGPKCFYVGGSGSHVYPRVGIKHTLGPGNQSNYGHLQIRWRHSGIDHYRDFPNGYVVNWEYRYYNADFWVDANTYVCGRWWSWSGSRWYLKFGDWTCVRTHP